MEIADHYRSQREELSALALTLDAHQLARPVPGCPLWTVKDLLGHLVGLPTDALEGRMDGAPSEAWTQAQVDARRDVPVPSLVEEWAERGPAFEAGLEERGFQGWVFTFDVTMHGDDLREALGLPLGSSETHRVVLDGIIRLAKRRADGLGTLTVRAGDATWALGEGEPQTTLTAPGTGELARVFGARRSDDAVRALAWDGDPEPWVPVLPLFRADR